MNRKIVSWWVVLVILATLVVPSVFAEEPVEPKGTLVALSAETFTGSWDPTGHTVLANWHAEWNCFDRLVDFDTETKEVIPRLATEWEWLDPTTLEMKLREGVKFHDGSDFEASDVKASIERWSDQSRVGSAWWGEPATVEIVDDHTVRIKTSKPFAPLLSVLTISHMMSSDDIAEEKLTERMNGTGYFRFVKYEDQAMYFEANMDGWDGPPKVKEFVFQYMADPATRLAAVQTGEAHFTERVESEQVPIIEADPSLDLVTQLATEQKYIVFKVQVPPMENETLRRALSYAVDRETITNDILQGFGRISESHLSPEQWGWAPADNLPTYDPTKSAELLEEAGYPAGEGLDDLVYKTSVGFYPKTKEYGEYLISNWADVGVDVEFQPMEVAAWLEVIYDPVSTAIADTGWMPPALDPDIALVALYKGPGQLCFIEDPEIDAVLDAETSETMDPERRKELIETEALPLLAHKVPHMPLFTSMLLYAVNSDVEGIVFRATSMFDLKNAVVNE